MTSKAAENSSSLWRPETAVERQAVLEQLERMLASDFFRNSRRYPNLLRYTVEHTLQNDTVDLKERTLGVNVFGRAPDYDSNADPVVRTTAVEVRKRIAQYYRIPEHRSDIRIDLPSGSYVPEFRLSSGPPESEVPAAAVAPPVARPRFRWAAFAALLFAGILCAVWAAGFHVRATPFESFWNPVFSAPGPALLCLSIRPPRDPLPAADDNIGDAQYVDVVAFNDAVTLSSLTGVLRNNRKAYRIRRTSAASLDDLRDGPVVLIGAFNNAWSRRLTANLRFSFARDEHGSWIQDARDPSRRRWQVKDGRASSLTEDYALISRVFDPTTGSIVVVAGGLLRFGTLAAGEFLTDPRHMAEAARLLPGDWGRRNLQIVIATRVVGEIPGPPRVLAAQSW